MPKVYIFDDPRFGQMLNDKSIVKKGDRVPIDKIDAELLEQLIKSGRVKEVTVQAKKPEAPPAPKPAEVKPAKSEKSEKKKKGGK